MGGSEGDDDGGSIAPRARPAGVELTAGAVARRLGVAPSTLRSWARRYGVGPAEHESGRYRRYSERDVAELETMCRLVGQGVAPSAAAAVARQHVPGAEPAVGADPEGGRRSYAQVVRGVVGAAHRLDADAVVAAVAGQLAERGVVATWQQMCRPALATLDREVAETGGCIDAQLIAAWAISTALRPVSAASDPPAVASGAGVLLACTDGEQHTLALEALHAALAESHLPARMLGPSVPDVALAEACRRTGPDTVVLWAQTPSTARAVVLDQVGASAGSVLAVGPGWAGLDLLDLPATVDTVDDLPAVLRHIAGRLGAQLATR
ncbi:MerR family transcriptional regulator [Actinomycetospora endophytica]|uniref:MerR family transcriptional regulator n=1 Tax=Actinomycetospora endophytica TaxID=2291215 RepID=A0ABS8PFI2_9PSEU|nr:MerR family transcriptional regulator [Actinomycetospora endophytica]MCD2196909.1 MerR family transcriptional regulator [Actinomycetospora endophytica]